MYVISIILIVYLVVALLKFIIFMEEPPDEFSLWDVLVVSTRWLGTCLMWPLFVVGHIILFTSFIVRMIKERKHDRH
jgi:tellurite resistance protein TehA-like permease